MRTGSMSHVKVCVLVCHCVALQRFLGNHGTKRLQIFSVDRHQQKKLTVDLYDGRYELTSNFLKYK